MANISISISIAVTSILLLTLTGGLPTAYSSLDSSPLTRGFVISPTQISLQWRNGGFRPFLTSPNGRFCLGFVKIPSDGYVLSIMYTIRNGNGSSESSLDMEPVDMAMVWSANEKEPGSATTVFSIDQNGKMSLIDGSKGTLWSPNFTGKQLLLRDSGNLVLSPQDAGYGDWQSFDYPTDTLLPGQNFTSTMKLSVSISEGAIAASSSFVNGSFNLKMEANDMALYADLGRNASELVYWRLLADEATASINQTLEPIYARIESMGYMGMYQRNESGNEIRVSYNVFQTYNTSEIVHRRMKLDSDGNLRVYYWDPPSWAVDFIAVLKICDLPAACGPYGICNSSNGGDGCECPNGDEIISSSSSSSSLSGSAAAENQSQTLRLVTVNGSDARQGCAGISSGNGDNHDAKQCAAGGEDFRRYIRVIGVDSVFRKTAANTGGLAAIGANSSSFMVANNGSMNDCQALCDADCECIGFFFTNNSAITCFLAYHTALAMQSSNRLDSYAFIKVGTVPPLQGRVVAHPESSSGLRRSSVEVIVSASACLVALGIVLLVIVVYIQRRKSRFSLEDEVTALRKT